MTRTEFVRKYNPDNRCKITYMSGPKEVGCGIALDGIQHSLHRQRFLEIDSVVNRVLLADVLDVVDTGLPWAEFGRDT